MVEENCTDIVQVTIKRKDAASCLVGPDFNFVIITAGHEERLCFVEINAPDRTVVLFESVNQCAHAVVP